MRSISFTGTEWGKKIEIEYVKLLCSFFFQNQLY